MIEIRRAENDDFEQIWPIIHDVFSKGDTYSYSPDTSKEEAFHLWMGSSLATYVALENGKVVGTYFLKQNRSGLGSHVCNAGYAVSYEARGKGIGRRMCEHSLEAAKKLGFLAMQYNFVVSTNQMAVELWKKCGFDIVGTLPKAFKHKEKEFLDVYIMYQWFA